MPEPAEMQGGRNITNDGMYYYANYFLDNRVADQEVVDAGVGVMDL